MKIFLFGNKKTEAKRATARGSQTMRVQKRDVLFAVPLKVTRPRSEREIMEAFKAGRVAEI